MVGVYAGQTAFQSYGSGVLNTCNNLTYIDHVVLLVGWTADAWIIKNSWNTYWGENGYGRISFANDCGISRWLVVLNVQHTENT